MKKFHAVIRLCDIDHPSKVVFSKKVLEEMAKQAPGALVTFNFNHQLPLGRVEKAEITETDMKLDLNIADETLIEHLRFGPAGIIEESHMEGDIRVIDKFRLTSVGLTFAPPDIETILSQKKQSL